MAIVGTGVLVLYVQGAEDRALEGEELVRVLTATAPIPAGTSAEQLADLVEEEDVPVKVAPEGVISDLVSVSGLVTAVELRSEEHTSELQSLMRISYAVFCLKKKNKHN